MSNLNDLTVTNAEYDLDNGFFFIELSNGKSLQCCLKSYQEDEFSVPCFHAQIELDNNGYNNGLCADCNEWAVFDGEWSHINDLLIDEARKIGIEIVA